MSGSSSSACFFHCAMCVGCTPYSLAISLMVFCPLIASNATFAFSSVLCRFRCIWFLLLWFTLSDTAILSYGPVQFLGDIIHRDSPFFLYGICDNSF